MGFGLFVGLLILLRIALFLYFLAEGQFYMTDSALYFELADNLIDNKVFSQSQSPPFEPQVFRTPGYPAFLALLKLLGMEGPYWVVFWQELIYALCIGIFLRYGKQLFDHKMVRAGLIFMLLDPGGLVYPKFLMSEILFLPFVVGGLLAAGLYLKHLRWRYIVIAGALMGIGALIRPAIAYLPLLVIGVLLLFNCGNRKKWLHAGVFALTFSVMVSPWLARNYYLFGKLFMTGQQSNMLVNYHVPHVLAAAEGISFHDGALRIQRQVEDAIEDRSGALGRPLSVVETFETGQQVALSELSKYPWTYLKQWLYGTMKAMNGPFISELYDSFGVNTDRVRFSDLPIGDLTSRVLFYFKSLDPLFLLVTVLTVAISGFAMLGVLGIFQKKNCFLWILLLTNFYFIFLPGPMGYPRFRFPINLFWFIQAYIGVTWIANVIIARRQPSNIPHR